MSGLYTNGLPLASLPFTGAERLPLDTQLSSGGYPETEAASLSQISSYLGGNLPLVASRFYGLPAGSTPGTLLTVTGTLYAYPYYISGPSTIKTIGIDVTTGQTGGGAFVGLYADNGAGYPGNLVTSSNNTSALIATSGAAIQNYTPTTALALPSGWYWLASIFTATGTYATVADVSALYTSLNTQLGSDTALHLAAASNEAATGISVAATYGTLSGINAGVFPASATLTLNAGTPLVILGT
jgi:hypothetical protein